MNKDLPAKAERPAPITTLSRRRLVAVVVGIENYRALDRGLPKVDYAVNDATAFAEALKMICAPGALELELMCDSHATAAWIDLTLKQAIESLGREDAFVFYYAGHGFHGAGGNRITAWDSHPFHIEDTTLLLRKVLIDRLTATPCESALAFVDACASAFEPLVRGRDVITSMNPRELKEFLASAAYRALFLSCKPGQKSYPAPEHRHGAWTYFLLRALRGEADEALGLGRFITDATLRDYLRKEVPRYLSARSEHKGNQTPQAIVEASNTFAIRHVPEPSVPIAAAGDLSRIRIRPTNEYVRGANRGAVRKLEGFDKRRHQVFATTTERTDQFVRGLLEPVVNEEIQKLYERAKEEFSLRSKDLPHEAGDGQGNLDCEFFRFTIETRQSRSKSEEYILVRRLELREAWETRIEQIDSVFGSMFDQAVIEIDPDDLDYENLVEFFEDVREAHGGDVKDEQDIQQIAYTSPDDTRLTIDVGNGRIIFSGGGRQCCSKLIARARQYRFTLGASSRLLISRPAADTDLWGSARECAPSSTASTGRASSSRKT